MDREPDWSYEIIDFGSGPLPDTEDPDRRIGDRPEIRQGQEGGQDQAGHHGDPPPDREWWRWLSLTLALLVGVGAGAYGWEEWRDHQQTIADRSSTTLVGGVVQAAPRDDGTVLFSVEVQNLGAAPVRVEKLLISGWPRPATAALLGVEIESGQNAAVQDVAVVNCEPSAPDSVFASVVTANGQSREVKIRRPGDQRSFDWPYQAICTPPEGGIVVSGVNVSEHGRDWLRTSFVIENSTSKMLRVIGLTDNRAFQVEGVDLPWLIPPRWSRSAPGRTTVEIIWRVRDCRAASAVVASELRSALIIDTEPRRVRDQVWWMSEGQIGAELIRIGVRACQQPDEVR